MRNKIADGQMDFFGLLSEYTDDQGATVRVREPRRRVVSREPNDDYVQLTIDLGKKPEPEKPEAVKEEFIKVKPAEDVPKKIEPERVEPVNEEPKKAEFVKPEVTKPDEGKDTVGRKQLFKDCSRCWCHDCKHNLYNEAVPRELAGRMIPCPACKTCEEDGNASLCEIGNAKEGCKLRALEEGIIIPETEEI